LHGAVLDHADGDYDVEELPDLFTRRAHHAGIISGHELLSYSFLGGRACEPRRSLRRKHRWVGQHEDEGSSKRDDEMSLIVAR